MDRAVNREKSRKRSRKKSRKRRQNKHEPPLHEQPPTEKPTEKPTVAKLRNAFSASRNALAETLRRIDAMTPRELVQHMDAGDLSACFASFTVGTMRDVLFSINSTVAVTTIVDWDNVKLRMRARHENNQQTEEALFLAKQRELFRECKRCKRRTRCTGCTRNQYTFTDTYLMPGDWFMLLAQGICSREERSHRAQALSGVNVDGSFSGKKFCYRLENDNEEGLPSCYGASRVGTRNYASFVSIDGAEYHRSLWEQCAKAGEVLAADAHLPACLVAIVQNYVVRVELELD